MNRRPSLILTALAAAAIVGGVAVTEATDPAGPTASVEVAQEVPTEEATDVEALTGTLDIENLRVTEYEVFLSRDPFEPVIVSAAAAPPATSPDGLGGVDPAAPAPAPAPTDPAVPAPAPTDPAVPAPAPTDTPAPAQDSGCVDTGTVVCDGSTVTLVDVFEDADGYGAAVQVDSTIYEVRAGDTFASNYRLLSISDPCATMLYGDDAFTLCTGESILK